MIGHPRDEEFETSLHFEETYEVLKEVPIKSLNVYLSTKNYWTEK